MLEVRPDNRIKSSFVQAFRVLGFMNSRVSYKGSLVGVLGLRVYYFIKVSGCRV